MKPSGKLQLLLLLLPVLTLLLAPPAAGWKTRNEQDRKANRHHLGGRRLHSAPNKDGVSLEDLETVSVGEKKHVQEAVEAPSSIEDQLRQVNGLEAQTDASFQKAFSAEEGLEADEKSAEDKVLQDLASRAAVSSASAPSAVSLESPAHEPVGGLEELDAAADEVTATGAESNLAKMSDADRTPIDHRAQVQQSANAPVALPTDKQAQADAAMLLKYSNDHMRLRPFFEEMIKNGGRDRVTRAEAVAKDIDVENKKQAQADATMLAKYKNDVKRLRHLYEEMDKHGGQDRVARADKEYESIGDVSPRTDKTVPKISQVDKVPIDHHVPSQQNNINAAAVVSGMPPVSRPASAPSVLGTHQQSANAPVALATDKQAQADAVVLVRYSHDDTRLHSYLDEMLTHGGRDRVSRAEAAAIDIKKLAAQADASMLAKYSSDATQLRAFYEEMDKNGGQERINRAEATGIFKQLFQAQKGRTALLGADQQAHIDAALLIKHSTDVKRLRSIYDELRSNGGQDRVNRAEAIAQKMKR